MLRTLTLTIAAKLASYTLTANVPMQSRIKFFIG
jgi:hypothetical protein